MDKTIERGHCDALLNRLRKLDGFMPISITHSERPDFILKAGCKTIGLEVTLAIDEEYIRATKLQQIVCPQESIIITNLKDREPRRSNQEIVREMLDVDAPWVSLNERLINRLGKIEKALLSKRVKLNQANFQLFDENWLLIYDLPTLGSDDFNSDRASQGLYNLFKKPLKFGLDFNVVFIYSDRYLFRWNENKLALNYTRT